jgi:hypothetical protein
MCEETRAPHSVLSAATSQDRGVSVGDCRPYIHANSTKPSPQQTSAILASSSLTLIIHTSVDAVDGGEADECQRDAGHERDCARLMFAQRGSIRACGRATSDRAVRSRS